MNRYKLLVTLLPLILATGAMPQTAPASQAPTPPSVGAAAALPIWRYINSHSYEERSPGLGISHRHQSQAGWIDVYVYTLGQRDWQPGLDAHFTSTIDDVRFRERTGDYTNVVLGSVRDVTVSGHSFRTVNFQYGSKGRAILSTTLLSVRNGQLLKYRISILADAGLDIDAVAQQFVQDNLKTDPTALRV